MFLAVMKYSAEPSPELEWKIVRQKIARETGWEPDVIENLSADYVDEFFWYEEVTSRMSTNKASSDVRRSN
jgi:hypothetical protein